MLFISESGCDSILQVLVDFWNVNPPVMRLFKNPATPSFASVLADFTDCNFSGYAEVPISDWELAGSVGNIDYVQSPTACTFLVAPGTTPPQLSYGYYLVDSEGNLLWAELDPDGPTDMSSVGNSLAIFARLGLSNCPP